MYSDDPTHYDYLDSFNPTGFSGMFNDFIAAVKASTGIESVAIEYLPYGGAERETALSRMRTEIMAGGIINELQTTYYSDSLAMLPVYTRSGGIKATVTSFAAVNASTAYAEEAFGVIDLLMQEDMQQNSILFHGLIASDGRSLPLQKDLYQESKPSGLDGMSYFEDELYEDLCNIRDNITEVSFKNKFDNMLKDLTGSMQSDLMMNGTYDTSAVPEIYDIINRSLHE